MTVDTLVLGLGSIGQRHARVLESIGRRVATVSRRGHGTFTDLATALQGTGADYVVLALETSQHAAALETLAALNYQGIVLVEKPLFAAPQELPHAAFSRLCVGYNLRFHPVIARLYEVISEEEVLTALAYVGQHLSTWRPGRDYRQTSSAARSAGGGVIRDLSHELDLMLWLFGNWGSVDALVGHSGTLDVDVEDIASLIVALERCPAASVNLNYLDHSPARTLRVICAGQTIVADLLAKTLDCGGKIERFDCQRDHSYAAMHRAVLAGDKHVCTAHEGLQVVSLIGAAELAAERGLRVHA